jgi:hypothetical protein
MKSLIFILSYFIIPIFTYGQETDSEIKLRIDSLIKISDSIGEKQKEGISEGDIIYNHISGKYGWEAYFLNDVKEKNQPLRIRYSETQPKSNEDLNLYYQNGILVFAELITTPNKRKSRHNKTKKKCFYFDGKNVIYPDLIDSDIDYVLGKEKTIRKMIYE